MSRRSIIVVGAGAGGLVASGYLAKAGHDVLLLEAREHVGGCASRFAMGDFHLLAGATTLIGLEPAMPLGIVSRELGFAPRVRAMTSAMELWDRGHKDGSLVFSADTESNVEAVRARYGAPLAEYWREAVAIASEAWSLVTRAPFPPSSIGDASRLATDGDAWRALPNLIRSAGAALARFGDAGTNATHVLDELLLISTQATAERTPALFAAIGVEYLQRTFFMADGGLGGFLEQLRAHVETLGVTVRTKTPVMRVSEHRSGWRVATDDGHFDADAVVLDLTHWDAERIVQGAAKATFTRERGRHPSAWGACCIYLGVEDVLGNDARPYTQIVLPEPLPSTRAGSVFATVSPANDASFAPHGYRAITASCHTRVEAWETLSTAGHDERKAQVKSDMLGALTARWPALRDAQTKVAMVATPRTWTTFTGRELGRVGGLPFTRSTLVRGYPTGSTGSRTLVRVGDTVFPGQSVAAVAWGARRVARVLSAGLGE